MPPTAPAGTLCGLRDATVCATRGECTWSGTYCATSCAGRTATAAPLTTGLTRVWGQLSDTGPVSADSISGALGATVVAPISGVVSAIELETTGAMTVSIDSTQGGFRFTLTHLAPLVGNVVGTVVEAGRPLARLGDVSTDFSIVKLATGRYGQRTVRPAYFYLTQEQRDGRR